MKNETRAFGALFAEPPRNGLTRPKAVRGAGTKMVNMGELFAFPRIRNVSMDRVPLSKTETDRFTLKKGDLLFARQSLVLEGAGKCSIFLDDEESVTFESHVTRVRLNTNEADPQFYFYYLQSHHGRAAISSIVEQGAGASGIRGSDLGGLNVIWYPPREQRAIAHILGTLDDKIELNRKQNETLEAMARALFKSWFVDFDPVRAKIDGRWQRGQSLPGLPAHLYDLFPDRLVDSELGEIPDGWGIGKLGDVAEHPRRGVQPNQFNSATPYIALEHMPKRCIALSEWANADGLQSNKFKFKRGEILFGKLRPYFHKVGVAPLDGVCSTDIVVIAPKAEKWFGFVLGHVFSDQFVEYTNAGSTGTKMPRTNWADMARYTVLCPSESVAEAFNSKVRPMTDELISSIHESRTLSTLRDTLLPRLVSGEIRVQDIERIVGAAV
ncbi:MAG: restriction endonuclease subunit S [Gammaproteobacteria bacterium]|nr:MAG: restriction endonuclease subunit S [Gammaproteobacteria bacterium]